MIRLRWLTAWRSRRAWRGQQAARTAAAEQAARTARDAWPAVQRAAREVQDLEFVVEMRRAMRRPPQPRKAGNP